MVPKGTVRNQEIAEQIAGGSGYSTGTTKGMPDALAEAIARNYKGSKKMKERLKSIDLKRDSEARATRYSPELRKGRMLLSLQEKEFFTTAQYMRLNGCNRSTAARDVKELIETGKMKKLGYGKTVLYVPVEK